MPVYTGGKIKERSPDPVGCTRSNPAREKRKPHTSCGSGANRAATQIRTYKCSLAGGFSRRGGRREGEKHAQALTSGRGNERGRKEKGVRRGRLIG